LEGVSRLPICELCGRMVSRAMKIEVEGATVEVCGECASKAKARVIREIKRDSATVKPKLRTNLERDDISMELESKILRQDYGRIIREARERCGLRIEDLARIIGEKSSVIQRIEAGKLKPDLELASKLEKILKISLFEATSSYTFKVADSSEFVLTVADILAVSEGRVKRRVEDIRTETGS
ncbi:MAG: multiprotein bridging factor aMBF1, partial [Candidatus Bathyarchaeota archaeon]|nr:multiprotein bridging factor aMBF1 [Candidatus Bathyarchaeota archaeon]